MSEDVAALNKKLLWMNQNNFGSQRVPIIVADTTPYVAPAGYFVACIKAKGGDVAFTAATATDGSTPSLSPITEDDVEYFPLTGFTLASGTAYVYLQTNKV